jgi:glucose-6-phosphate dehydrogenase assembly protein OpcA
VRGESLERASSAKLQKVSVSAIRDELRALWASEAMNDEAVIRARTHNLIVYTAGQRPAGDTAQWLIEATLERPGRVILIDARPGTEPGLDAWVTTYCRAAQRRQVCGELVTLAVGGPLRDELHSTVVALLAADLPVYLWWTEIPDEDDHLFEHLAGEADRVLVDSDAAPDAAQALQALAALDVARLGDLNWARLTPWRRLLAQLWDTPTLREHLAHIRSLDVHHIARDDFKDAARALLLVGWLVDRLGYELVSAQTSPTGGYITTWQKGRWQGKVEIVESTHAHLDSGEIVGVFIQAGAEPPYVMPRLALTPEQACIELRLDDASPTPARLGSPFQPVSLAEALAEELDFGYDPVYRSALTRAAEIVSAAHT